MNKGEYLYFVKNDNYDVLGSFFTLDEAIYFAEKKKKDYMSKYDRTEVWVEKEGREKKIYRARGYEKEVSEELE